MDVRDAQPMDRSRGCASYAGDEEPQALPSELRAGDDTCYEELVHHYGGRMLSVATRILGNNEDGRDCVQDAFRLGFKNIRRFEGRSSVWTWLHRIVVNTALQKLRWRSRRPEGRLDLLLPRFDEYRCRIEPKCKTLDSVETLASEKEIRAAVREAIESLPEDYRSVILLRDIEEIDTRETATILHIKPGAVRTRLHRARAALKKLLEPVIVASS